MHLICVFKFDKTSHAADKLSLYDVFEWMQSEEEKSENYCHELHTFLDDERQTYFCVLLTLASSTSTQISFLFKLFFLFAQKIKNSIFVQEQQVACNF